MTVLSVVQQVHETTHLLKLPTRIVTKISDGPKVANTDPTLAKPVCTVHGTQGPKALC